MSEERSFLLSTVNVTPHAMQNVLMFPRVPKSGSSNFAALLDKLGKENNFTMYAYRIGEDGIDTEIKGMGKE